MICHDWDLIEAKLNCFIHKANRIWREKIISVLSLHARTTNVTFSYHLQSVFGTSFHFTIYLSIFLLSPPFVCHTSKYPDAHTNTNGRNPRVPFIPQTSVKVGTKRFRCRLNFAGGRGSWPATIVTADCTEPNQCSHTYWWTWVAIAWKKVAASSGGNYLIGIKNWLPREYK